MRVPSSGLDEVELSDVIGEIYDCVIDPSRWDATLDRLRRLLDCAGCALYVTDLRNAVARMQSIVGLEPAWAERFPEYAEEAAAMMASVPGLMSRALDEPIVGRRDIPDEVFRTSRYWQEWAVPQGTVDFVTLNLMRGPERVAGAALGRFEEHGLITDREVRLLRLIAPHLRRAVTITDLIDMKSMKAETLGQTLDLVSAGVVLVAENAEILHANRAADRMLRQAAPISSVRGKLSVADAEAAARLREIVGVTVRSDAAIGDAGIGMPLGGHDGPPATVHVLPIAAGALRSRLEPRGAAAVFVASESVRPAMNLLPVAEAFGLSPAETRVLARLLQGESLEKAAAGLNISRTTAKTHLSRLFAKTGTKRQAALIALVNLHVPPLAGVGPRQ